MSSHSWIDSWGCSMLMDWLTTFSREKSSSFWEWFDLVGTKSIVMHVNHEHTTLFLKVLACYEWFVTTLTTLFVTFDSLAVKMFNATCIFKRKSDFEPFWLICWPCVMSYWIMPCVRFCHLELARLVFSPNFSLICC